MLQSVGTKDVYVYKWELIDVGYILVIYYTG